MSGRTGAGFKTRYLKVQDFSAATPTLLATAINAWALTQTESIFLGVDFRVSGASFVAFVTYTSG